MKKDNFFNRSFSTIMLRGVGIALSFSMLLIITNVFPDEVVGKYQYFNSILILAGTLALLGLNVSFVRFSGELMATNQQQKLKSLYYKNVFILFITTALIFLTYYVVRYFLLPNYITPEEDKIYFLALIAIFPNSLSVLNFQVLLGLRKLYLSEFFRNVMKFTVIILSILAFYFLHSTTHLIQAFLFSFVFLAVITTIFVIFILNKDFSGFSLEESKKSGISYKKILKVSLPMTLSFISLLLMQQIDLLILKRYSAYESLAYYGVAVKISMILNIVLMAIDQVIGPQVAELFYKKDMKSLKGLIGNGIVMSNLFTLPAILIIFIFPETILGFFGKNYVEAKTALLILIAGQAFNAFAGSTNLYLNMTGKQNFFQRIILIALIINLILNFLLIPDYGMVGAAIATAVSLIFWNVISVFYIKKKDNIWVVLNPNLLKDMYLRLKK